MKQVRVKKPKPQKKVVSEGEGGEKEKKKRPSPKESKALWLAKQAADGGITTGGVDKPEEKWKKETKNER